MDAPSGTIRRTRRRIDKQLMSSDVIRLVIDGANRPSSDLLSINGESLRLRLRHQTDSSSTIIDVIRSLVNEASCAGSFDSSMCRQADNQLKTDKNSPKKGGRADGARGRFAGGLSQKYLRSPKHANSLKRSHLVTPDIRPEFCRGELQNRE